MRRADPGGVRRGGQLRIRTRRVDACARYGLSDHPSGRYHGHRRLAGADRHAAAGAGDPRWRGTDAEGQLHRHGGAEPRHSSLHRAVPPGAVTRRPVDERQARSRRDQRGLRPPARRQRDPPGGDPVSSAEPDELTRRWRELMTQQAELTRGWVEQWQRLGPPGGWSAFGFSPDDSNLMPAELSELWRSWME